MAINKHLIDTNVLLVASAADDGSPFPADATPVDESELRGKVLDWLREFQLSDRHIVLDYSWRIVAEYRGDHRRLKLTEQDYGMQVVLHKYDSNQVHNVQIAFDSDGTAILANEHLAVVIHDAADKKMVAAVIEAGGSRGGCNLVNACDTDWYDWEEDLQAADVYVHQLIDQEWCRPTWKRKQK